MWLRSAGSQWVFRPCLSTTPSLSSTELNRLWLKKSLHLPANVFPEEVERPPPDNGRSQHCGDELLVWSASDSKGSSTSCQDLKSGCSVSFARFQTLTLHPPVEPSIPPECVAKITPAPYYASCVSTHSPGNLLAWPKQSSSKSATTLVSTHSSLPP